MECAQLNQVLYRGPDNIPTVTFMLVLLTSMFAGCLVHYDWEVALDSGGAIFSRICGSDADPIRRDSLGHIFLR